MRDINATPGLEWVAAELKPFIVLPAEDEPNTIQKLNSLFRHWTKNGVSYATFRQSAGEQNSWGFMRMPPDTEREMVANRGGDIRYSVLQGTVEVWFGESRKFQMRSGQIMRIPQGALYGLVNNSAGVTLLEYRSFV